MIEKGTFFTPDKKGLLITEVQDELNKINMTLRNTLGDRMLNRLTEIKDKLNSYLKELVQMKGVVTPSKTDEILDSISTAKKTRLETNYVFGMQKSTLWLLIILGVSVGVYYKYKKI